MDDEKLQFAISQYVDGVLPADQVAQLEERLKTDADARKVLEEFRRINDLMNATMPIPEMDWEHLTHRISAAVDASVEAPIPMIQPQEPATVWWASWRTLALAASVLVAVGVAWFTWRSAPAVSPAVPMAQPVAIAPKGIEPVVPQAVPEFPQPKLAAVAQVEVYAVVRPQGEAQVDVQVSEGQTSAALAPASLEDLTASRSASVTIASVPVADVDADSFAVQ